MYGYSKYKEVGESLLGDLKFWSTAMLVAIGGGIVLTIIIQIVFHIILAVANEVSKEVSKKIKGEGGKNTYEDIEIPETEDEMDKLIALKAMRNAFVFVGFGFVISLISLRLEMQPAVMLNILFMTFFLGSIFEGFSQLYYYRRGVSNG
jgi:hypothetical protein